MSKRFFGILITVAVLQNMVGSPVAAASADVILTHIQAGVSGGATQEFIGLYNNGPDTVDITGWCLMNKTDHPFACFENEAGTQGYRLPGYSSAAVVSESFHAVQPVGFEQTLVYVPTSASSGSLVGTNDRVVLVDKEGEERDRYQWTASAASGSIFQRTSQPSPPLTYVLHEWKVTVRGELPQDQTDQFEIQPEVVEVIVPELYITELLPNADGSDETREFIELYNAGDVPISLYGMQLWVGTSPTTPIILPNELLDPKAYRTFYNAELPFTLANTTGGVRISLPSGEPIDETDTYTNPKEEQSWALIEGIWQYSNLPTPGSENIASATALPVLEVLEAVQKPCAANQYRSPETGRCRLIPVTTQPKPCEAGEYRSQETGRCRKVAVTSAPAACKEGQERNPETGRCRNVKAMPKTDYSVLAATTESSPSQWYVIAVIVLAVLALAGYAVWEWRHEVGQFLQRIVKFVRRAK